MLCISSLKHTRWLQSPIIGRALARQVRQGFATTTEEEMTKLLEKELDAAQVVVEDVSGGCGASFRVEVVSSAFEGKKKLDQNRMVHRVLKNEIPNIHALTVVTKVPSKE